MTSPRGFFIEQVTVVGSGLPSAQVDLSDGLNVVAGASDTGKSYLCSLVDFGFGASARPRPIEAARGYERVVVRLVERGTKARYEVERSLSGGDVLIRTAAGRGKSAHERAASAKHDPNSDETLSAFLLALSGFGSARLRKNKKGDTRTLSFRDLAFLCVVDEARIIAESPPHLSGSPIEATVEGEVLRFLLTGRVPAAPIVARSKASGVGAKAQAELLAQLGAQVETDIGALGFEPGMVRAELERVEAIRSTLLQSYESTRVELVAQERTLAGYGRDLRDAESRLVVIEGLLARFVLLDRHYDSDINRLITIGETGMLLESIPAESCPVCGAPPQAHRPAEANAHFGLTQVREAAATELAKTKALRGDLGKVLSGLREEVAEKEALRTQLRQQINDLQRRIERDLEREARASVEKVRELDARRDVLVRARALVEQLDDLTKRATDARSGATRARSAKSDDSTEAKTSEMDPFAEGVQKILEAWRYPDLGRVVFSEDTQDLVIGGEERASHGKGVRALTCAAFIAGILRHCRSSDLPHPGLVVLDSPLVAYKDPDTPGTESARLRGAGVKEAFYQSLADGICPGQVVVLENEDPTAAVAASVMHHHFSKATSGRYGFFPNRPGPGASSRR